MNPRDEELILQALRRAIDNPPSWIPAILRPMIGARVRARIPDALSKVPVEAMKYTVRDMVDMLRRAHAQGRI